MQFALFKNEINKLRNRNNNNIPSNLFLRNCFTHGPLIFIFEYFSLINWIVLLLKFFGNICFTLLTCSPENIFDREKG